MMLRWHLQNATHMVEFQTWAQAKEFRATHPAFKRRRIRAVFQAYPNLVPLGKVMADGEKFYFGEEKGKML